MKNTIIRPRPLMKELGVTRHGLKIMREQRGFPDPIPLGLRGMGYFREEVDAWLEARKAERDAA